MWIVHHQKNNSIVSQICRSRTEADRVAGHWQDQGCEAWITYKEEAE